MSELIKERVRLRYLLAHGRRVISDAPDSDGEDVDIADRAGGSHHFDRPAGHADLPDDSLKHATHCSIDRLSPNSPGETHSVPFTSRSLIVVVEDDADDFFLLKRTLLRGQLGIPVHWARSGSDAIEMLQRIDRDVSICLLLDLKLPDMDGFELLAWIRSQTSLKEVKVVFLTGCSQPSVAQKALASGADEFLVKPCGDCSPVMPVVRRVLGCE